MLAYTINSVFLVRVVNASKLSSRAVCAENCVAHTSNEFRIAGFSAPARAGLILLRPSPAVFLGIQLGQGYGPDIELWTLTADIPGHPARSTVSRETLEEAGCIVPITGLI